MTDVPDLPDEPLRILLVTKGLDIGGLERMVVGLAAGLRTRGHVVDVALVNARRRRLVPELDAAGVAVRELRGTDRVGWRGVIELAQLVRSDRFDVVHVHGPLPSVVCRLVPGGRPIVTTSHTPLAALRRPTRLAWRVTARRDVARIAVSVAVQESVGGHATVIPHGIDVAAAATSSAHVGAGGDEQVAVAIAVASHRRAKNYPNLLRAVVVARDEGARLRLVAIGEGPDLERHRDLARELGVDDIVSFEMPSPDVLRRIAAADLLVVSSDWEGQPMVIAEAIAVGTPVVSTAVGHAAALVGGDVGRIVVPGDHVALGRAIAELAADPGLRRSMSDVAHQRGAGWTLDDAVDAHLEVYAAAASGVRPRRRSGPAD